MDHYLSQIAPTLKHLIEANTLRSSNQLQKEQEKTGKADKSKKGGGIVEDSVKSGTNAMGDDLFDTGSSSLSYEGFSNARSWAEWQEKEQQDKRQHDKGQGLGETAISMENQAQIDAGIFPKEESCITSSFNETADKTTNETINELQEKKKGSLEKEVLEQKMELQFPFETSSVETSKDTGAFQYDSLYHKEDKEFSSEPIESRVHLFARQLIHAHDSLIKEMLVNIIAVVGEQFLRRLSHFGVRVIVVPQGISLASLGFGFLPSELEGIRAAYLPYHKIILLGEEHVINWNSKQFNLPLYLLAHAFDHALGNESFASTKSPAVLTSFAACKLRQNNHQFLDGYSAISPVHYFARAVTAYFTESGSSFISEPSFADVKSYSYYNPDKNFLTEVDPLICQYLLHLFSRGTARL